MNLREYADHQQKSVYITPVFDRCQEFMNQARQFYEERNSDGKLGSIQIPEKRDQYVQLQAADLFVWEYRMLAETYISTREMRPGPILDKLRHHSFGARIWTYDFLEYLKKRVEAAVAGDDPDTIPCPSHPALQ